MEYFDVKNQACLENPVLGLINYESVFWLKQTAGALFGIHIP